jgi:hypothetical protein
VSPHPSSRPRLARGPLRLALAVTLLLATFGSFAAAFGGLTACTNDYSCTVTDCAPCATANDWFMAGWAGQGLLLLAAGALALLAARRVRPPVIRMTALWITALSLTLFVATTALAQRSF